MSQTPDPDSSLLAPCFLGSSSVNFHLRSLVRSFVSTALAEEAYGVFTNRTHCFRTVFFSCKKCRDWHQILPVSYFLIGQHLWTATDNRQLTLVLRIGLQNSRDELKVPYDFLVSSSVSAAPMPLRYYYLR
jgi:hypothetical protein